MQTLRHQSTFFFFFFSYHGSAALLFLFILVCDAFVFFLVAVFSLSLSLFSFASFLFQGVLFSFTVRFFFFFFFVEVDYFRMGQSNCNYFLKKITAIDFFKKIFGPIGLARPKADRSIRAGLGWAKFYFTLIFIAQPIYFSGYLGWPIGLSPFRWLYWEPWQRWLPVSCTRRRTKKKCKNVGVQP